MFGENNLDGLISETRELLKEYNDKVNAIPESIVYQDGKPVLYDGLPIFDENAYVENAQKYQNISQEFYNELDKLIDNYAIRYSGQKKLIGKLRHKLLQKALTSGYYFYKLKKAAVNGEYDKIVKYGTKFASIYNEVETSALLIERGTMDEILNVKDEKKKNKLKKYLSIKSTALDGRIYEIKDIKEKLEKYSDNPQIKKAIDEIKLGILALGRTCEIVDYEHKIFF